MGRSKKMRPHSASVVLIPKKQLAFTEVNLIVTLHVYFYTINTFLQSPVLSVTSPVLTLPSQILSPSIPKRIKLCQ